MKKNIDDSEVFCLVSELTESAGRLSELRERKKRNYEALEELENRYPQMMRIFEQMAQSLNHVSEDLTRLSSERAGRVEESVHLRKQMQAQFKIWRTLRKRLQDAIGRDICPECGSTNVAPIHYGLLVQEPDEEVFETEYVNGGCCVNLDETVCCLDCGKGFLSNFDKWQREREAANR